LDIDQPPTNNQQRSLKAWHSTLNSQLDYTPVTAHRCPDVGHQGPLRILKSLYPEGDGVIHKRWCTRRLVGGDTIDIQITVASGAHGLVGAPGATRFYKSGGHPALQQVLLLPIKADWNGCHWRRLPTTNAKAPTGLFSIWRPGLN